MPSSAQPGKPGQLYAGQNFTGKGHRARVEGASRLLSIMVSGSPQAVTPLFRHPRVRLVFSHLVLSGGGAGRAVDVSAWRGLQAGGGTVGVTPLGAGGGVFVVLSMGGGSPVALTRHAGLQVTAVSRAATLEAQLASHQENLAIGIEFAAAIAGVALAMLALVLSAYFGGRRYEYEAASFEALGAKLRNVVSTLAFEYGAVVACSAATGMGVGLGLLAVTLSYVTSPAGGPAATGLLVDWPAITAAAMVAAASLSGTLLVAAMRIRRLSPVAVLRGEPE